MALLLKDVLHSFLYEQDDWRLTLLQNWDTIVGSLKNRVRLEKIDRDIVVLGVYESHWMQELFLLSRVFLQSINNRLDKPRITSVRFKLVEKKEYPLTSKRTFVSVQKRSTQPIVLNLQQKQAIAAIADEQLGSMLVSFLARCTSDAS